MTANEQLKFFQSNFGKRPTPNEVAAFKIELQRANLDVMADALRQAEAVAKRVNRPPPDIQSAVLAQYDRIVALNSQLFPVFFVFESAFRTLLADALDAYYGAEDWWHSVRDGIERGDEEADVYAEAGSAMPREVVRAIFWMLHAQRQRLKDVQSTYDLMKGAPLYDLGVLLDRHWSLFAGLIGRSVAGGPPTRADFGALFTKVRRARNDAFHQLVVKDRPKVLSAAERLLDLIDIHLGERVARINGVVKPDLVFPLFKEGRHQ